MATSLSSGWRWARILAVGLGAVAIGVTAFSLVRPYAPVRRYDNPAFRRALARLADDVARELSAGRMRFDFSSVGARTTSAGVVRRDLGISALVRELDRLGIGDRPGLERGLGHCDESSASDRSTQLLLDPWGSPLGFFHAAWVGPDPTFADQSCDFNGAHVSARPSAPLATGFEIVGFGFDGKPNTDDDVIERRK